MSFGPKEFIGFLSAKNKNSNRKIPYEMAKSKTQTHQSNGEKKPVIFLNRYSPSFSCRKWF